MTRFFLYLLVILPILHSCRCSQEPTLDPIPRSDVEIINFDSKDAPSDFYLLLNEGVTVLLDESVNELGKGIDLTEEISSIKSKSDYLDFSNILLFYPNSDNKWTVERREINGLVLTSPLYKEQVIVFESKGELKELYSKLKSNYTAFQSGGYPQLDESCQTLLHRFNKNNRNVISIEFDLYRNSSEFKKWSKQNICSKCLDLGNLDYIFPVNTNQFLRKPTNNLNIDLVNIVPKTMSGETDHNREPFIAGNINELYVTCLMNGTGNKYAGKAPLFYTSDIIQRANPNEWQLHYCLKGNPRPIDATVTLERYDLYVALLKHTANKERKLNTYYASNSISAIRKLPANRSNIGNDQPYISSYDRAGFISSNTLTSNGVVMNKLDAEGMGERFFLAERNSQKQYAPCTRNCIASDGSQYVVMVQWGEENGIYRKSNIYLAKNSVNPNNLEGFKSFKGDDGKIGKIVQSDVVWTYQNDGNGLNGHRVGSELCLAVNPNNSEQLYLAYQDTSGSGFLNMHLIVSNDGGDTWQPELGVFTNVIAPALAVHKNGTVAFSYTQLEGLNDQRNWVSKIWQYNPSSGNRCITQFAITKCSKLAEMHQSPKLGDYSGIIAGVDWQNRDQLVFKGVFAAHNEPNKDNFPNGVHFQRRHDFVENILLSKNQSGNTYEVPTSVDPFYFSINCID